MNRRYSSLIRDTVERKDALDPSKRKCKIVCTLGWPARATVEHIRGLLRSGMNVARINFSHGDHESHAIVISNIRQACKEEGVKCAILLDTKGPEIRTGGLVDGDVKLQRDQELDIMCIPDVADFPGDSETIALDYVNLPNVVQPGSIIKIDDGLIVCEVLETSPGKVKVRVQNEAELGTKKGVNLPGTNVDLPAVTEKDKKDIRFGVEQNLDFIAASFIRDASAVEEIREILGDEGKQIKIISKIENQQGLENYEEILDASDGIMVARGDLGVEIPIQQVCMAQKYMIKKCNIAGKPVITATQMLDSMISSPQPTRAEANDVANAVFDGTDCVMLSGETAKGKFPEEAIKVMARICLSSESAFDYRKTFLEQVSLTKPPLSRWETIASAAVKASMDIGASAILVLTTSGRTGRLIAKYMPPVPVITLTTDPKVYAHCLISRCLHPVLMTEPDSKKSRSEEEIFKIGLDFGKAKGFVKEGDEVVVVCGQRHGDLRDTSALKIISA